MRWQKDDCSGCPPLSGLPAAAAVAAALATAVPPANPGAHHTCSLHDARSELCRLHGFAVTLCSRTCVGAAGVCCGAPGVAQHG